MRRSTAVATFKQIAYIVEMLICDPPFLSRKWYAPFSLPHSCLATSFATSLPVHSLRLGYTQNIGKYSGDRIWYCFRLQIV